MPANKIAEQTGIVSWKVYRESQLYAVFSVQVRHANYLKIAHFVIMKIALQYVSDRNGKPQAVQMPVNEWEKVLSRIRKSEQVLQLKSDLKVAFKQVDTFRKSKAKKQTLTDFLNDL